jgi:AraC family transcriptional regulator
MFLKEFPDLAWIQKQSANNFSLKKDCFGNQLKAEGWPNVILNVRTEQTERDNILGTFSLFMNLAGNSVVQTGGKTFRVSDDFYCISNKNTSYNLHIPKNGQTETFNIHFGENLMNDVITCMERKSEYLLDNEGHFSDTQFELLPKLYLKNPKINAYVSRLQSLRCEQEDNEYLLLSEIFAEIYSQNVAFLDNMISIKSVKNSTKKELLSRVTLAADYLTENALISVSLDELASHCALSKFHLLRTFKSVFGCTPMQYHAQIKLKKAKTMIVSGKYSISETALLLGFSELSAFSRFFKSYEQKAPLFFVHKTLCENSNLGQTINATA